MFLLCIGISFASCRGYLDVVPDNTLTIEDIFSVKAEAYNALAKVYSYLPKEDIADVSTWLLGDEYIGRIRYNTRDDRLRAIGVMRALQTVSDPRLGIWSGTGGTKSLYQGISICNIFIDKIDLVLDMSDLEKADWKAQAKFMKAYYHFLLLQRYGPIVIADKQITAEASKDEIFPSRSKVDDCFNYIVRLMDEAISDLQERRTSTDLGQVDKLVAAAIKTRVLLFRASPFYSGNKEFYEDFLDRDKKPFFPVNDDEATTKAKWKDVLDAADEAITLCERNGKGLYTYEKVIYPYDMDDIELNRKNLQTYYNLRMVLVDPWNKELIWGYSGQDIFNGGSLQTLANIRLPVGYTTGVTNNNGFSEQWLGATLKMINRYYTVNGLPLEADAAFSKSRQYDIVYTPPADDQEYDKLRGIMQPDMETVQIYMDREPRFYANLGITGGYWRGHAERIPTTMYMNQAGGYSGSHTDNFLCTGIGIQKFVHPESKSGDWRRVVRIPYPLIRMADLYLMRAEALNEYLDAPDQDVWDAINIVRTRAGIPDVEDVWSDLNFVRFEYLDKHKTKDGMRNIILQERGIELAFEGSRFWDMIRHRRAVNEFSAPIYGWSVQTESGSDFFVVEMKDDRYFQEAYYLWPIDLNELNTNSNIIQNPGW